MLPLLYVVRMDVESTYLGEFVKWYDTRHGPDLIGTGFHSCSAYHVRVGGPLICNVYEVPNLEIFSSPAYVQVRQQDKQLVDEVLKKISNHSNTIYTQEAVAGVPDAALRDHSRPSRAGAVSAPVVSTCRLDVADAYVVEFRKWFERVEAPSLMQQGALRCRLARQTGKHPLFPSRQADWMILVEWPSLRDAHATDSGEAVVAYYQREHGATVSRVEHNVAALSATLLNSDSWTR